ncbi:unnamed protein product [Dovyalis caffra]|uniref:Uncharacterized protein n=1 Tax=Dovyalis caffra TaxID=77055 RepID=A0AAV1S6E9_9ROSI|nr:unnamed protein product [Dovyalis caffra]
MRHYCLGACMSLRKTLNNKLSVQPSNVNARHLSNLVITNSVYSPIPKSTFPQLSLATKRQLIRKVWCSYDAPGFSWDFAADDIDILIRKFFYAIHSRDELLLEDVLSHDCILVQDVIFQIAFVGEQNIYIDHLQSTIQFLCKLMKAMGRNIRFKINSIDDGQSKDDRKGATVFWNLEWNDEEIPFTRGCTVFEFEEIDEKLLIRKTMNMCRKITGVTEPGKLGDFILKLLEAASTLFDNFPDQTRSKQKFFDEINSND